MKVVGLRRYSTLPALIFLLQEKKITLLDPEKWDDRNDSNFLRTYKRKKQLRTVLALCFTQGSETYHHWRVFAPGDSGVCIRFRKQALLEAIKGVAGVRKGNLQYLSIKKAKAATLTTQQLPFRKRAAFADEVEFRLLYESVTDKIKVKNLPITLACIDRVILSPWIEKVLADHTKATLHAIPGCRDLRIDRSTLTENDLWRGVGERSVDT